MTEDDKKVIALVEKLNDEIYEALKVEDEPCILLEFSTTGYMQAITFGGFGNVVWCSESDEREWDDDKDDWAESLEDYVRRETTRMAQLIGRVKLT